MRSIDWRDGTVVAIDQSKLPHELRLIELRLHREVADAIRMMKIRGAPLIGVAGALGLALVAFHSKAQDFPQLLSELGQAGEELLKTRPTGFNLEWAVSRILEKARSCRSLDEARRAVISEAKAILEEEVERCRLIGEHGAALLKDGDTVLTHCNAGALATVEYGTALSVIRSAVKSGKRIKVIATETRPVLQGARLTTFELMRDGIPVTLITDSMVGFVMSRGLVDAVMVGADRILKTGYVINKIGTYTIAVLAKGHGVPFYVVAPWSTIDLETKLEDVVIEERSPDEVLCVMGKRIAPEGTKVLNPAFDVTPPEYVTAIITERGILKPEELKKFG